MIASLLCRLRGHAVNRRRVWHDGYDHRTSCQRCSTELIRYSDGWREFDPKRDGVVPRKGHPHHAS